MSALAELEVPKPTEAADQTSAVELENLETVGRLVSGVAHDFNNLLTGIVLCSDLLLAGLDPESRLRRYAQEIRSASAQGASLVRQLSAVVRPGTGESTLLSFNDVVSNMRVLLGRLIGENIELRTTLADHLRHIRMIPAQARQIVLNLALNARDAMPDGGQMLLITRNCTFPDDSADLSQKSGKTWVEFEVRDTGTGMDAQTRARIFQPFFTTKAPDKGTGLGLTTVLKIVRQHHGNIEVASEPGQGTSVTVRFASEEPPNSTQGKEEL